LDVLSVEASDVSNDLALIRVDPENIKLTALEFAQAGSSQQGMRILAFGNPLGLKDSVVEGIVSATREVEGRPMLQLAMPIEPGNSGGPLVDMEGRVHGIVNMKSAIDDNLGFAIPIDQLISLKENPNPVAIGRWVRLRKINQDRWQPLFGATWEQRGGRITARGSANSFGGRSLLLSRSEQPDKPLEIAVSVRLDDESGAAGLAFHSDGKHKHYGFYPSAGRLRLTCFRGPTVYSWQVLEEVDSEHYLRGQWNHLKVRIEPDRLKCFVNGHLVIESTDLQLTDGQVGLATFRGTKPEFKRFQIGTDIPTPTLADAAKQWLAKLEIHPVPLDSIGSGEVDALGQSGDLSAQELVRRAITLEQQAKKLRQLADDVQRAATIQQLSKLAEAEEQSQLLRGTLLIALLDNPDVDIDAYESRIDEMADQVRAMCVENATATQTRAALHRYLFQENGYHGSRSEYYHPANSHLNRVIDDREGLPITMSILYMEIGRRLGLTIEGVGLPGHFVVKHVIDKDDQQLVDVFERGKLLDRSAAAEIVAQHARRRLRDEDLRAQSPIEILTRVLNNLIGIAGQANDGEAMLRYCNAAVVLNPEVTQFRLMRAQLRGLTGRKTAAMEDLDWLLDEDPPDLDREMAEHMREALQSRR
jgi:regulator of sirC expression with transglutaminase-like and TPR domain